MFEVQDHVRCVRVVRVRKTAFEPWNYIILKFAYCHPFDFVDLSSIKLDLALIFAEFAAIEYVKYLVAFRFAEIMPDRAARAVLSKPSSSPTSRSQAEAGDSPRST